MVGLAILFRLLAFQSKLIFRMFTMLSTVMLLYSPPCLSTIFPRKEIPAEATFHHDLDRQTASVLDKPVNRDEILVDLLHLFVPVAQLVVTELSSVRHLLKLSLSSVCKCNRQSFPP